MPILKCSVPNCTSTGPEIILHRFPHGDDLREIWLKNVRNPALLSLNKDKIVRKKVCHKHFEKKFIMPTSNLSRNAHPTLFTSIEISSGIPDKSEDNSSYGSCIEDHTYCGTIADKSPKSSDPVEPTSLSCALPAGSPTSLFCGWTSQHNSPIIPTGVNSLTYITVSEKEVASQISRALVERDLAASVDILSETKSVYKSLGKIILMAKTRSSRVSDLCEFAAEKFPLAGYQIVSVPIENGNPHYLKWISDTVPPH